MFVIVKAVRRETDSYMNLFIAIKSDTHMLTNAMNSIACTLDMGAIYVYTPPTLSNQLYVE